MVDLNRYLDGTPGGELLKLKRQCSDCRACPHGSTRSQVAFARGDERSTIAFVGEAPDERDESQGHPFASGFADGSALLLDRMIGKMREHATAIGVTFPEQPYICNVLKCRPSPKLLVDGSDVAACSQWLWQQLRLLPNLRVVVALGRVAAQTLLQVEEPIGQLRAEDKAYHTWDRNQEMSSVNQGRVKLIVTWHPLYLLRQPNNKQPRQESWSDLQRAVEVLR